MSRIPMPPYEGTATELAEVQSEIAVNQAAKAELELEAAVLNQHRIAILVAMRTRHSAARS